MIKTNLLSCWRYLREELYPLKNGEAPKVFSLFGLFFFILFNYVVLRTCKETLIINVSDKGAAAIPFINIWLVGPFAFFIMMVEIKLFSIFKRATVFYINIISFTSVYLFYIFICFPHMDALLPVSFLQAVNNFFIGNEVTLERLKPILTMIEFWPTSLFYVIAESWITVVLGLLFWGFANDVTKLEDAKRLYAPISLGGPLAYFLAGHTMESLTKHVISNGADIQSYETLYHLLSIVGLILAGVSLLVMLFYHLSLKYVLIDRPDLKPLMVKVQNKKNILDKKHHMGTWESLLYVAKMPYLRHLSITVICYGMSINLIEVYWKSIVKDYFPNTVDCLDFMAKCQIYNSYVALVLLVLTGILIRYFGWMRAALVAPVTFLITGSLFFAIVIFKDLPWNLALTWFGLVGLTPLGLAVYMGMAQNVLSKAAKNTLYNVTKELAYIPLDEESRIKGKSAIDILGERVGKWGGAFLVMLLIFICGDLSKTVIPTAIMLIAVCLMWIYSTWKVGKTIQKKDK
jgi:AAA family ATP:ADP antiporter